MIEYHVLFKSFDGFQKEESLFFENNEPPSCYYMRKFNCDSYFSLDIRTATPEQLVPQLRHFTLIEKCFVLGKNIVIYKEGRY